MKPTDALFHPSDWHTDVVSSAIEIKRGVSWSTEQEHTTPHDGAVPVVGISNVQERLELDNLLWLSGLKPKTIEQKRVEKGWSVMVGSNGNRERIGNAVFVEQDAEFLFASFLLAARPRANSGITPEFFFRWLRSEQVQSYLSASSEGSTGLSNLSLSFFRKMKIAFPKEEEQTAIARILAAVDGAIDRVREAVIEARELQRALLQDFFYSALGVTAYADHPSQKLPTGWQLTPTESLLAEEPKNGISPQATAKPPGTPTFSIAAVRDGKVDLTNGANLKYASISDRIAEKFKIKTGDVLVVRGNANSNLVGKAGRVGEFPEGCIYPDITKRIVFRRNGDNTVSPEYAVLAWNHPVVHNQVLRRAKTSNGTLKINNRDVKQIVMPVPPPSDQLRIVELVTAADAKGDALGQKLVALEQLKRSLMHDLLTGTIRVDPALFKLESTT
jgi:type I restriction enzyme S subunit